MTPDDEMTDPLDGPIDDPALAARLAASPVIDELARRRAIGTALGVYDEIHPAAEHRPRPTTAYRWVSVAAAVLVIGAAGVVVATRLDDGNDPETMSQEMVMMAAPEPGIAADGTTEGLEDADVPQIDPETGTAVADAPVETAASPEASDTGDGDTGNDDAGDAGTDGTGPDQPAALGSPPAVPGDSTDTSTAPVPDDLQRLATPADLAEFATGRPRLSAGAPSCAPSGAAFLGQVRFGDRTAAVIALGDSVRAIDPETCAVLAVAP